MRWDILGGCFEMGYIEVEGVRQAAGQVLEEYGKSLMQQSQKNSEGFTILTVTPFTFYIFNHSRVRKILEVS